MQVCTHTHTHTHTCVCIYRRLLPRSIQLVLQAFRLALGVLLQAHAEHVVLFAQLFELRQLGLLGLCLGVLDPLRDFSLGILHGLGNHF